METVQIVLEKALLRATDRAARQRRLNRSAWVREAIRAHLKRLETAEREQKDRAGYTARPLTEFGAWDEVTEWPDR
jgi:metal-responsive CopG/Arc/MetJ family transcriptional regulator